MDKVILHITYSGEGDCALQFAKEMTDTGLIEEVRSQPGCLSYTYYVSYDNPNELFLVEIWESQELLDKYQASKTMEKIASYKEVYKVSASVRTATVSHINNIYFKRER